MEVPHAVCSLISDLHDNEVESLRPSSPGLDFHLTHHSHTAPCHSLVTSTLTDDGSRATDSPKLIPHQREVQHA